jgi:hypothetical protein
MDGVIYPCLTITYKRTSGLLPVSGNYEKIHCEYACVGFGVDIYLQLSFINT